MALFSIHIDKLVLEVKTNDSELLQTILKAVNINNQKITKMALTITEAVEKIDAQATKLEKIKTEVTALKDAVANSGNVDPAIEAALARVDAVLTEVDDINEDATTGEGEGEVTP